MSTTATNDAELVVASLSGDRDAFGHIVSRYQSLICSLAYSATGSLGASEDLAQETFITAWKHLRHLRERSKLKAWLCGIARNRINNTLRREGREPVHTAEPLEEVHDSASIEPLPREQTISREEEAILWRSLERIPEIYREPLVLFYREHHSIENVAAALDLSEATVKQRLSRGRKLLTAEVTAFVEGALVRTNPGKAFTIGVLTALALTAPASGAAVAIVAAGGGAATGATTSAKVGLTNVNPGTFLGPGIGWLTGWLATKAVRMTARSEQERLCVTRHCHRMVLSSFALCALLVLTLSCAGVLYPVSSGWLVSGVLAWVVVLVATILAINSRMQSDVQRIRAETGTNDPGVD